MHVLKGRVRDGVIVPDEPLELEEGQIVEIHSVEDHDFELTEAQAAELERRIEFTEKHPDKMIPREQVMAKLRALTPRR